MSRVSRPSRKKSANRVQQGVGEFHDLIGGKVEPPREVRFQLLSDKVEVDDAHETRCINYSDAKRQEKDRLKNMVGLITDAAMEHVNVGPSQTALVIAINASPSICREERPPNLTERCLDAEERKGSSRRTSLA